MYDLSLSLTGENGWFLLGMLVGLGLLCGLLAGSYPALVLSRINPIASLKGGKGNRARGRHLRNALVVVQFALSIILIVGAGIVWRQVQHMKNQNLNFDRENVVVIPTSLGDYPDPNEAAARIETIKGELARTGGIASVASSMSVPGRYANANVFAWPEDWEQEDPLRMRWAAVDDRYFGTYEMEFLEGRNFSREFATDADEAIILNETAMRAMGWTTAVGKKVRIGNRDQEVVGVVRDFHFESLEQEIRPVIHIYRSTESRAHNFISVRVASSDLAGTLGLLERRWQSLDPDRAFDYFFIDEDFDRQYQAVVNTSALIGYFSILAILIACIGLLGLVSFTVTQRTKEIGVRKVLGASTGDIVLLLTRQFTWPVVLANLVAWPLAYWFVRSWLEGFAYRIGIPWGIFLLGGFAAVAVAWLTVGYLSVRAAREEPIEALRYE
jgi:putative ABC transport system permease protein